MSTPKRPAQPKKRPRRKHTRFGLPVRDAPETLVIPLLQVDIDEATKVKTNDVNDPNNFLSCVIAQGCTRVCGSNRVAIMRRHAFVAFPGEKHTKRYVIDEGSRDVLERWDRGERIVEGVELRLRAPAKSQTLAANRRRHSRKDRHYKTTERKQRQQDPLHNVVRNGNLVSLV